MTPEEFVEKIRSETPIWPYDDYNACHYCGSVWAEDTFGEWLRRQGSGEHSRHHESDCVWIVAHQMVIDKCAS